MSMSLNCSSRETGVHNFTQIDHFEKLAFMMPSWFFEKRLAFSGDTSVFFGFETSIVKTTRLYPLIVIGENRAHSNVTSAAILDS